MKVPTSNVRPMQLPGTRPPVPPAYLAMAAAHMVKLGKSPFEAPPDAPPNVEQITAALNARGSQ